MHSGTPWVNPTPSKTPPVRTGVSQPSFPSDRLPPKQKQKGSAGTGAKNLPKSSEVKRLESILSGLRTLRLDGPLNEKGPDPKAGCFCKGEFTHLPVYHTPPPPRARGNSMVQLHMLRFGGGGGPTI